MNFNESLLVRRSHELHEREVRIRFIGRRDRIPRTCAGASRRPRS